MQKHFFVDNKLARGISQKYEIQFELLNELNPSQRTNCALNKKHVRILTFSRSSASCTSTDPGSLPNLALTKAVSS